MTLRAAHAAIASEPFAAALDGEYHGELLARVQALAARADARAAGVGQGSCSGRWGGWIGDWVQV